MPAKTALPLYRTFLRQIRLLPHQYLRQFFRIKVKDDVRAIMETNDAKRRFQRVKRMSKDLRRMEAAINGNVKAVDGILNLAYGRKGKLKWELMQDLLGDSKNSAESPIIPAIQKSRPPSYSPQLKALLTSSYSRTTKALKPDAIVTPSTLPPRADPKSEEAQLLGPLSKRREVNLRWRFFVDETKKVIPPLHITLSSTPQGETEPAGLVKFGLQTQDVFKEIESIAGPLHVAPPLTRRERESSGSSLTYERIRRHPSRWLRRRYQALLARIPVLKYNGAQIPKSGRAISPYSVELSGRAQEKNRSFSDFLLADPDALAWYDTSSKIEGKKSR